MSNPYRLTLTADERKAIDWIGDRYDHGNTLSRLLLDECELSPADAEWADRGPITFALPEHVAWAIV